QYLKILPANPRAQSGLQPQSHVLRGASPTTRFTSLPTKKTTIALANQPTFCLLLRTRNVSRPVAQHREQHPGPGNPPRSCLQGLTILVPSPAPLSKITNRPP